MDVNTSILFSANATSLPNTNNVTSSYPSVNIDLILEIGMPLVLVMMCLGACFASYLNISKFCLKKSITIAPTPTPTRTRTTNATILMPTV
jgi:hypothetical protein